MDTEKVLKKTIDIAIKVKNGIESFDSKGIISKGDIVRIDVFDAETDELILTLSELESLVNIVDKYVHKGEYGGVGRMYLCDGKNIRFI